MNEREQTKIEQNPLGSAPVPGLMMKFAIPSIVAMLVGAFYNIVDQLFIGQAVGKLGNAATNVAFPLSTSCIAISLLFGIGGASCFNLHMGKGETKKAPYFIGNAATMLVLLGVLLAVVTQFFLEPMLVFFGAPEEVMPYASSYVRITSFGFPFLIFTTGGCHLVRADGSPQMAMICNITGAVINTILDAIFVLGFRWGMEGAALATIIGQFISAVIVFIYMFHFKTVKLEAKHFFPQGKHTGRIASIGMASFFNQLAMMVVQIVLNNSLTYYGEQSIYGKSTPLACAGIVMKVAQIFMSVVIGLSQGCQPIISFNYGAKRFLRVREAYRLALTAGGLISIFSFVLFQVFPRQIISLFGEGTEEYYAFGTSYFRVFLFFNFLNFLQPITSNFFTSIGKPIKGILLSLTRQILFLLPPIVIFPILWGIDGILYAGPTADVLAAIVAIVMVTAEFRHIPKEN